MFLRDIKQIKLKQFSLKKLVFISYLTIGLINKSSVISQPLVIPNFAIPLYGSFYSSCGNAIAFDDYDYYSN